MTRLTHAPEATTEKRRHIEEGLGNIRQALLALRFGSITVTVHEGRIVQLDVTEKKRLRPDP